MKKTVFIAITLIAMSRIALAQFEGAICEPSFLKFSQSHTAESIEGKIISYIDYAPGSFAKGYEVTTGQALKLALILIQDPSDLQLSRNRMNWIITSEGVVSIYFLKGAWRLFFQKPAYTLFGARVFTLSDKN